MRTGVSWLLASRRRVVFVTLAALLVLDLGRSLYARVGYAEPVSTWQPKGTVYADIAWPPGSQLTANASTGLVKTAGYVVLLFAAVGVYLFFGSASVATGGKALPLGKPILGG